MLQFSQQRNGIESVDVLIWTARGLHLQKNSYIISFIIQWIKKNTQWVIVTQTNV